MPYAELAIPKIPDDFIEKGDSEMIKTGTAKKSKKYSKESKKYSFPPLKKESYRKKYVRMFRRKKFFEKFYLANGGFEKNNHKRSCDHWSTKEWIRRVRQFVIDHWDWFKVFRNMNEAIAVSLQLIRPTMLKYMVPTYNKLRKRKEYEKTKKLDFSKGEALRVARAF